ncbi:hypothetical protein SAMN04487819_11835 [Actinopolyspora alba]|uniref:DUF4935 domain-containing protein n=1 Tax=Actinopolyspora alba TaxID=673379 RepID=A0A1I2BZ87_9ACTN|nr:PIN domain-containing protein [Actinopolyspora alba]SFE61324.1 hypothetical protein SAMN04487819_11835 [Actinopolyspora alba]
MGALTSALLRIASAKGMEVCLPEVVVDESTAKREELADAAISKIRQASIEASKYFDLEPMYVPDAVDAANEWRRELEAKFRVLPLSSDIAVTALWREIFRKPPAHKGKGARDAAIWLIVARHNANSHGDETYFVSSNVNDFAGPDKKSIDTELLKDLERPSYFHYFTGIESLLESIASPFDYRPSVDALEDVREAILEGVLRLDLLQHRGTVNVDEFDDSSVSDAASWSLESVNFTKTKKSYEMGDECLALVQIAAEFKSYSDGLSPVVRTLEVECWLELQSKEGPITSLAVESANSDSIS